MNVSSATSLLIGVLFGAVLAGAAFFYLYLPSHRHSWQPGPVSPEAHTHLASALNILVLEVEELEKKGVVDRADIERLRAHVKELQDRIGKLEWKA